MTAAAFLSVIRHFRTGTYTAIRQVEGLWGEDGKWAPGSESLFPVDGSIQPATGEQTKDLPEGVSVDETLTMYTGTRLKPPTDPNGRDGAGADRVLIDDLTYLVWKVEHFRVLSNHFRATLVLEPNTTTSPLARSSFLIRATSSLEVVS